MSGAVWIVVDESENAPQVVIGVFSRQSEALGFMAEVGPEFQNGALSVGSYAPGWSIKDAAQRYRATD